MKPKALFVSWMLASPSWALQTYPLVDQHQTPVIIAQQHHTRIAVAEDRIQQLFGAEGQFEMESDDERGQIFLKPLDPSGSKTLFITIVTEGGLTQDLSLVPKAVGAQSILFKPATAKTPPVKEKPSRTQEIGALMQAMMRGKTHGDYDKGVFTQVDRHLLGGYTLQPVTVYRGPVYTGRIYRLRNTGEETIHVIPPHLSRSHDVAVAIQQPSLKKDETTLVYIISHTGDGS